MKVSSRTIMLHFIYLPSETEGTKLITHLVKGQGHLEMKEFQCNVRSTVFSSHEKVIAAFLDKGRLQTETLSGCKSLISPREQSTGDRQKSSHQCHQCHTPEQYTVCVCAESTLLVCAAGTGMKLGPSFPVLFPFNFSLG